MTLRLVITFLALILTHHIATAQGRYLTENFDVIAPTKEMAKTFGEAAENFRKEKAMEWLGYELKRWPNRCPLEVDVRMDKSGGETTFSFDLNRPRVVSQKMYIFGKYEQLLNSILPHEVTHTIFAAHFGMAVPRWADEGGSVYSENEEECYLHDVRCRELLNQGQGIPLRVLFSMKRYPRDVHTLYAQGYSVVDYLVEKSGRKRFLDFIRIGMENDQRNWEVAVKEVYGFESVDDLQTEWIKSLKVTRPQLASQKRAKDPRGAVLASRGTETRTSPTVPTLEAPIARGAAPTVESQKPTVTPPSVYPAPVKLGIPEMPKSR
jgi:Peptidase MA superfamily